MYDYPQETAAKCLEVRRETLTERLENEKSRLTERLENEKSRLESRLAEVNEVLAVLKSDPKIQAVLDVLQRVAR